MILFFTRSFTFSKIKFKLALQIAYQNIVVCLYYYILCLKICDPYSFK